MDNHYHLLIETPSGNLSQIMRHINGAYTTYYNIKRKRAGHLFQGRYKSILVETDEYADALSRYIHLNPVKAKMVDSPGAYEWSSYKYYIGKKNPPEWLYRDFILGYFGKKISEAQKRYQNFVESMIDQEYESPLVDVVSSTLLGSSDFIKQIKDQYLSKKKLDEDVPAMKEMADKASFDEIFIFVDSLFKDDPNLSRNLKMHLCQRYSGKPLKEIAAHFGIGASGVSQASRRVSERLKKEKKLSKQVDKIIKKLNLSRMKT